MDCESINDEPFETREHIFHIRFSCGDMFIAADGNAADPSSCYFFDKDDNSDFGDCPYFDEICSDLELGLEM